MWPNLQFPAHLVTFTEEILNGKFIFCAVIPLYHFAHIDSDFYLQLCIWDDYHVFFNCTARNYQTAYSMRFTNLGNYHLSDWWWNVNFYLFSRDVILGFDYINLTQKSIECELASTIAEFFVIYFKTTALITHLTPMVLLILKKEKNCRKFLICRNRKTT